ncbi:hypothetical protein DdX_08180 [Ditylenchus destructor]|uniref:Uncharacterized protein n=1 Tax=Ditylenchus destructor TaxID=166010 RepID=A0AAD4R123_9BILA|nr:hypothetical protein DdX_08180 [Ditylenchus destructor]
MASIPVHSIYDEDRYYRCCCNQFHVERGAKIIAFLGAVLSAIFAVLQFLSGNLILFIFGLFHFLIYWSILYAQRKRQPFLYTPFLFINGLSLFFMGLYIIFLIVMLILLPDFWRDRETYDPKTRHDTALDAIRIFTWLQLIYAIISEFVTAYFFYVIWRAYKYMKQELTAPTILRKV